MTKPGGPADTPPPPPPPDKAGRQDQPGPARDGGNQPGDPPSFPQPPTEYGGAATVAVDRWGNSTISLQTKPPAEAPPRVSNEQTGKAAQPVQDVARAGPVQAAPVSDGAGGAPARDPNSDAPTGGNTGADNPTLPNSSPAAPHHHGPVGEGTVLRPADQINPAGTDTVLRPVERLADPAVDRSTPRPDSDGTQWYSVEQNQWIGVTKDHQYVHAEGPISPADSSPANTDARLRPAERPADPAVDRSTPRPDSDGTQWYSVEQNQWIGVTKDHQYVHAEGPISPADLKPAYPANNDTAQGENQWATAISDSTSDDHGAGGNAGANNVGFDGGPQSEIKQTMTTNEMQEKNEEQQSSLPWLASALPAHAGWSVRSPINPSLADHPNSDVRAWGQWKAEADEQAALQSAHFNRDVSATAAGTTTAFYTVAWAASEIAVTASEQAALWALTNPQKAFLAATLLQFGIGLADPHPPGFSPMDVPGPADDLGRLARSTVVGRIEGSMSSSDLIQSTVRHMNLEQVAAAVKETWELDKQGMAQWRGEIFEGVLASTRYKFYEWVGKNDNGFFRGLDFYFMGTGVQLKTLQAVPRVNNYKKFVDELQALKQGGVTPDRRPLTSVALDIAIPAGYKGPPGKEMQFVETIQKIVEYGNRQGIPVNVYELSRKQMNPVVVVNRK